MTVWVCSTPDNLVGCFMNERQQKQNDRAMRVRGTEPGPELEVSILGGLLTRIVSYNNPWDSLPTKRGPGRSPEVSCLQGDGGCQYLGPEVNHGYNALTNFVSVSWVKIQYYLANKLPVSHHPPVALSGQVACWSLTYCDVLWLCWAGVCLWRRKWKSKNSSFCSRRNSHLSLFIFVPRLSLPQQTSLL